MSGSPTDGARDDTSIARMRTAASVCTAAALGIGLILIAGWGLKAEGFKSFLVGHVAAKPNAALCIVLAATAQLLGNRWEDWANRLAQVLYTVVGIIAALTFFEWVSGWDLRIDQRLFVESPGAVETAYPGRMAAVTALELILLSAAALICEPRRCRGRCRSQWMGTLGLAVASAALLGYSFGADALYAFGSGTHVAFPVALALALLFLSLLLSRAEAGWIGRIASPYSGGAMLRRAIPFAVVAPWLLSWAALEGSQQGFYSYTTEQVLTVGPLIFLSLIFLFRCARALDGLDRKEQERRLEVEAMNRELESRVHRRTEELLAANAQFRAASRYARNLIEASLDPLVTIRRDGKIMDVNHATEEVTGVGRQTLIGSDFSDYFTDPENARRGYEQVFAMGLVRDYLLSIRRCDGRVREVLYNAAVFRDESGEVEGVFAAARDVTERNRTAAQLAARVRQQEAVATLGENALAGGDLQGLMEQAVRSVAQTLDAELCKVLELLPCGKKLLLRAGTGWQPGLVGKGTVGAGMDSQAGYTLRCKEPVIVSDLRSETRFSGPPLLHDHGVVSGMSVIIGGIEHPFGVLGVHTRKPRVFDAEDVHFLQSVANLLAEAVARSSAEEALRDAHDRLEQKVTERTAELAATNAELESFTYSVSHDLRAPLRHVDGFSKILLEQYGGSLDETGRHYLERVRGATQHMGRLVDDLLNLSRIGRQALQVQPLCLTELVQEIVSELQADNSDRTVEWRIGSLPSLECDAPLIRQVFYNLLTNALKFTRRRSPAVIEVGTAGSELFVRDNGVGFDPVYADKLFGVFQRLHRTEDFEGTGVGLATVRRILQKHGGDIRAEGKVDQGATFYFKLQGPSVLVHKQREVMHAA